VQRVRRLDCCGAAPSGRGGAREVARASLLCACATGACALRASPAFCSVTDATSARTSGEARPIASSHTRCPRRRRAAGLPRRRCWRAVRLRIMRRARGAGMYGTSVTLRLCVWWPRRERERPSMCRETGLRSSSDYERSPLQPRVPRSTSVERSRVTELAHLGRRRRTKADGGGGGRPGKAALKTPADSAIFSLVHAASRDEKQESRLPAP